MQSHTIQQRPSGLYSPTRPHKVTHRYNHKPSPDTPRAFIISVTPTITHFPRHTLNYPQLHTRFPYTHTLTQHLTIQRHTETQSHKVPHSPSGAQKVTATGTDSQTHTGSSTQRVRQTLLLCLLPGKETSSQLSPLPTAFGPPTWHPCTGLETRSL